MSVEMLKIRRIVLETDIKAAEGGVALIAPGRASKKNKPFRAQFDAASEAWRKQESHQWASETSGRFRSIIIGRLRRPSFNLLFSPGLAAGKCALRAFCFGHSTRSYFCNTASGGFLTAYQTLNPILTFPRTIMPEGVAGLNQRGDGRRSRRTLVGPCKRAVEAYQSARVSQNLISVATPSAARGQ